MRWKLSPEAFDAATLLDAVPLPLFIVDSDVRVASMNETGSAFLGEKRLLDDKRSGNLLGCEQASIGPAGCGTGPACPDCVIRNAVGMALTGRKTFRKKFAFRHDRYGSMREMHLLVTASPLGSRTEGFAMLILDDVTEVVRLRGIIPVCAWCKRVRSGDEYLGSVEEYLTEFHDVDITHGICEDCRQRHFGEAGEQ